MNKYLINSRIKIPNWIMDIKYNSKIFPNWKKHDFIKNWANCQVYAYELLRFNWKIVPDLRSSELWKDTEYSVEVIDYKPLDLLFFNNTNKSWWAHVGLYIWNNKVLHNTNKIWKPVIWGLDFFGKYDEYRILLWGKRFINTQRELN